ncbi:MAG TPA: hypothetical protein VMV69_19700 [Pirellulales bacterium]|nr:hypothetical protein [Pirellulales bacterium]
MGYLVGTDEAGYAPNLGPLVVSATVWQVPGEPCEADLYESLRDVVTATPARRRATAPREGEADGDCVPLFLADSKLVYKPAGGLANLEFGMLSSLAWVGRRPKSWREVWETLDAEGFARVESLPWHDGYDHPLGCDAATIDRQAAAVRAGADAAGVRLLAVRSRAVFPELWNERIDRHLNKCTVLSLVTLDLLAEVLAALDLLEAAPVFAICDKHGGRNCYRPLLQRCLTDALVEVRREGRDESLYGWGRGERRVEVAFRAKAERYLPAALASMASKYLRELAMEAFNEFWRRHVPGLVATAGYPGDAARFKTDIGAAQRAMGIDERVLWRYL